MWLLCYFGHHKFGVSVFPRLLFCLHALSSQVFLLFNYSDSQSAVNMRHLCSVGASVETVALFCWRISANVTVVASLKAAWNR